MGIFFSVAGFFQAYYTTEMAPAICALFGIGVVVMWQDFKNGGWRGWLLPIAIILTAAEQIYLLHDYPTWSVWMTPCIIVLAAIAVIALLVGRLAPQLRTSLLRPSFLVSFVGAGVLVLLLAPSVWAAIPVINNTTAFEASAGPSQRTSFTIGGRTISVASFGGGGGTADPKLVQYLEANQGSTKFLVATASSMTADGIILATNKPVMALGGFSGSDPILTTAQLKALVANGTVRYFLLSAPRTTTTQPSNGSTNPTGSTGRNGGYGGYGGYGQQSSVTSWVSHNCTSVPSCQWQSTPSSSTSSGVLCFGRGGANVLFECAA
jgi:4-amino-4-deoxy-L-arabinose transferase-like glycosyltransferase